jgi:hypothetical protein
MNTNTANTELMCDEWSEKGIDLCRFIWDASSFDVMKYRLAHFGVHVVACADRIIALRTNEQRVAREQEVRS